MENAAGSFDYINWRIELFNQSIKEALARKNCVSDHLIKLQPNNSISKLSYSLIVCGFLSKFEISNFMVVWNEIKGSFLSIQFYIRYKSPTHYYTQPFLDFNLLLFPFFRISEGVRSVRSIDRIRGGRRDSPSCVSNQYWQLRFICYEAFYDVDAHRVSFFSSSSPFILIYYYFFLFFPPLSKSQIALQGPPPSDCVDAFPAALGFHRHTV